MLKLDNYFDIKWLVFAITFTATIILLTHIPQEVMPTRLQTSGLDKLEHVMAYGLITFLFILSPRNSYSMLSASLLFFAVLVVGAIDELTQPFVNRIASFTDWLANVIGIVTVLLLSIVGKRQFQKTNTE